MSFHPRPHALSCLAQVRQCGGGPAILRRKMDLPLLSADLFTRFSACGTGLLLAPALKCPPRCWVEGLRCFDLSASVVRRSMWLKK